jgi:hypothetical protein
MADAIPVRSQVTVNRHARMVNQCGGFLACHHQMNLGRVVCLSLGSDEQKMGPSSRVDFHIDKVDTE